jgi:two-component system, LytTR family, sensor kinase
MKFFWKYLFPGLFGLMIYIIVRVINDTIAEDRFWRRDPLVIAIEIGTCVGTGYIMMYVFRRLFRHFDKSLHSNVGYKKVAGELFWVFVVTEIVMNALITPMAALTDDGLSWGDVATINVIPLLFSFIYYAIVRSNKLLEAYVNNKMQLEKLTNDHLQTELKFLKAQYHPHFLFNALNTVYFQMDENVAEAKKSIEKFSELLRYQLYDQQQTVPVSREIHYLQNFIELQKVRSSDRLQLKVQFDAALNGEEVYPLLFLPLVENAFKYVGGDFKICIEAKKEGKAIHFTVENSIPENYNPVVMKTAATANGIGLENLQRRLELLYPGQHRFTTEKRSNSFFAAMHLNI